MFQLLKSKISDEVGKLISMMRDPKPAGDTGPVRRDAGRPVFSAGFLESPAGRGMPASTKIRMGSLEPEGYGFIRTLGKRYGYTDKMCELMMKGYADEITNFAVSVSDENAYPGYRRFVTLGPGFQGTIFNDYTVMTVDHKGLFNIALYATQPEMTVDSYWNRPQKTADVLSIAEVYDRHQNNFGVSRRKSAFSLNHHTSDFRVYCANAASHLYERTIAPIGDREYKMWRAEDTANIDHKGFENTLKALIRHRFAIRLTSAANALRRSMDPGITRVMNANLAHDLRTVLWLSGQELSESGLKSYHPEHFDGPDDALDMPERLSRARADISKSRVQACRSYPVLTRHFSAMGELDRAICARAPLSPQIAYGFNISETGVRNLQGLTWQMIGKGSHTSRQMVHAIGGIPRDFMPANRREHRMLQRLISLSGSCDVEIRDAVRHYGRNGSPWKMSERARMHSPSDLYDFLSDLSGRLYLPAMMRRIPDLPDRPNGQIMTCLPNMGMLALKRAFFDISASDLDSGSQRWHNNIMRHNDRIVQFGRDLRWRPFLGEADFDEVHTRELSSSSSMASQGAAESHCVGGYDGKVMASTRENATIIFSMEREGAIIGTLELSIVRKPVSPDKPADNDQKRRISDGWNVITAQHHGKGNSAVGAVAKRAEEALKKAILDMPQERLVAWIDGLAPTVQSGNLMSQLPDYIASVGFNPWNAERMQIAWDEMSVYLPRGVRRAGLEAFTARFDDDIRAVLSEEGFAWGEAPEESAVWSYQNRLIGHLINKTEPEHADMQSLWHAGSYHRAKMLQEEEYFNAHEEYAF